MISDARIPSVDRTLGKVLGQIGRGVESAALFQIADQGVRAFFDGGPDRLQRPPVELRRDGAAQRLMPRAVRGHGVAALKGAAEIIPRRAVAALKGFGIAKARAHGREMREGEVAKARHPHDRAKRAHLGVARPGIDDEIVAVKVEIAFGRRRCHLSNLRDRPLAGRK